MTVSDLHTPIGEFYHTLLTFIDCCHCSLRALSATPHRRYPLAVCSLDSLAGNPAFPRLSLRSCLGASSTFPCLEQSNSCPATRHTALSKNSPQIRPTAIPTHLACLARRRYSAMKLARSMPLAVPFSRSTPLTSSSLVLMKWQGTLRKFTHCVNSRTARAMSNTATRTCAVPQ